MGSLRTRTKADFIKNATATAQHFGFAPLSHLEHRARASTSEKIERPKIPMVQKRIDALHGFLTKGISSYFDYNLASVHEPILFYSLDEIPRQGGTALSLQVIGIEKSIAEALLIHTIRALYRELSYNEHVVRINSLGDRESFNRYTRELGNYLRKRIELLPPLARELMKEHALSALMHLHERDHEIATRSPNSLEYLNEQSRKHFREIVEYLDFTETPYEIDTRLLGHHQCYSQTLFAIDAYTSEDRAEKAPLYAQGGRYDEFVYQQTKRSIPAVGAVVMLREQRFPARLPSEKLSAPGVYLVQIGFGPKLRSLQLLDELRQARIPVSQLLSSDSLSAQLEHARKHNAEFTIILGQKEYVDRTAIIRNMRTSSQETVPLSQLVTYLRKTLTV